MLKIRSPSLPLIEAGIDTETDTGGCCPSCLACMSFWSALSANGMPASATETDTVASALWLLGSPASAPVAELLCARFGLPLTDVPELLFDEFRLLNAIGSGGRNGCAHRGQSSFLASCLRGT